MKVEELKKMSPAQREELRKALEEADAQTKLENEDKARTEIQAVLAKYTTTLEHLFPKLAGSKKAAGRAGTGERKPVAVVYQDTKSNESWQGTGPTIVTWLRTAMDNGVNPDKYLVPGMEHKKRVTDYWAEVSKKKK